MRVHLIKRQTLVDFAAVNSRSRSSIEDWLGKLKQADWEKAADMKSTFGSADLLGKDSKRVVFNLGGNAYRVICKYVFGEKQVHLFVCWIGSHAEYDELNASGRQYTVDDF